MQTRYRTARIAWLVVVAFALMLAVGLPVHSQDGQDLAATPMERGRAAVDDARCADTIGWLADPAREGRLPGTPQAAAVADFIETQFRDCGFVPPPSGSYRQAVPGAGPLRIGPATTLRVTASAETSWTLTPDETFQPFAFSAEGTLAAHGIVFVGFGITAPEWNYDDYDGIDVRDRLVLMLRHEPAADRNVPFEADPTRGMFFDGVESTGHATFTAKATEAIRRGAAGMILVNRPGTITSPGDDRLFARHIGGAPDDIFALQVTVAEADRLLRAGGCEDSLTALEQRITASQSPHSFSLADTPGIDLTIELQQTEGENVIGVLPGRDPQRRREVVVIGAHRDHIGHGHFGSTDPNGPGQIHPGANDNASGTTALMEVAHAFHAAGPARRTVVLIAFDGEERGLLGSRFYVANPSFPRRDTVAMINMDMVGRYVDSLWWSGLGSSPWWQAAIDAACEGLDVGVGTGAGIVYASDNASFYRAGIPAIFTGAGRDPNYHSPRDTLENVFPAGIAQVARAVFSLSWQIAEQPHRLPFRRYLRTTPEPLRLVGIEMDPAGQVPVGEFGVPIQAVTPGSPAEAAGLQPGDIIQQVDAITCFHPTELAAMLTAPHDSSTVTLTILRGDARLDLSFTRP